MQIKLILENNFLGPVNIKNSSNPTSKQQMNSQFFNQRNSKNVKYKKESLRN